MDRTTLTKQQQRVSWLFRDFRIIFFSVGFSFQSQPVLTWNSWSPHPPIQCWNYRNAPTFGSYCNYSTKRALRQTGKGTCPISHSYSFYMLLFVFCTQSTHSNCRLPFCPLWDLLCQACLILQAIWLIQRRVTPPVLLGIPPLGLAGSLGQGELQGGKGALKLGSLERVRMACVGPLAPAAGWWELGSAVT